VCCEFFKFNGGVNKMAGEQPCTDLEKIEALIHKAMVCRLGINNGKTPYVVPLCFGYRDNTLYFHSGPGGEKLNLLKTDQNVCFEFDRITEVIEDTSPCSWDVNYQSVIGYGKATFIEDTEEKMAALEVIISQYTDGQLKIEEARAKATVVFQVAIDNMTFKQNPEKACE